MDALLPALAPEAVARLFPFALAVDDGDRVTHVGRSLQRLLPGLGPGADVGTAIAICSPAGTARLRELAGARQVPVEVELPAVGLRLRGQVEPAPGGGCVLLAAPVVADVVTLARLGLRGEDLALHDPTLALLRLSVAGAPAARAPVEVGARLEALLRRAGAGGRVVLQDDPELPLLAADPAELERAVGLLLLPALGRPAGPGVWLLRVGLAEGRLLLERAAGGPGGAPAPGELGLVRALAGSAAVEAGGEGLCLGLPATVAGPAPALPSLAGVAAAVVVREPVLRAVVVGALDAGGAQVVAEGGQVRVEGPGATGREELRLQGGGDPVVLALPCSVRSLRRAVAAAARPGPAVAVPEREPGSFELPPGLLRAFAEDLLQATEELAAAPDRAAARPLTHRLAGATGTYGYLTLAAELQALSHQLKAPAPDWTTPRAAVVGRCRALCAHLLEGKG